jgi:hypothetical protein
MPSNGMAILPGYGLLLSDSQPGVAPKAGHFRIAHHSGATQTMQLEILGPANR